MSSISFEPQQVEYAHLTNDTTDKQANHQSHNQSINQSINQIHNQTIKQLSYHSNDSKTIVNHSNDQSNDQKAIDLSIKPLNNAYTNQPGVLLNGHVARPTFQPVNPNHRPVHPPLNPAYSTVNHVLPAHQTASSTGRPIVPAVGLAHHSVNPTNLTNQPFIPYNPTITPNPPPVTAASLASKQMVNHVLNQPNNQFRNKSTDSQPVTQSARSSPGTPVSLSQHVRPIIAQSTNLATPNQANGQHHHYPIQQSIDQSNQQSINQPVHPSSLNGKSSTSDVLRNLAPQSIKPAFVPQPVTLSQTINQSTVSPSNDQPTKPSSDHSNNSQPTSTDSQRSNHLNSLPLNKSTQRPADTTLSNHFTNQITPNQLIDQSHTSTSPSTIQQRPEQRIDQTEDQWKTHQSVHRSTTKSAESVNHSTFVHSINHLPTGNTAKLSINNHNHANHAQNIHSHSPFIQPINPMFSQTNSRVTSPASNIPLANSTTNSQSNNGSDHPPTLLNQSNNRSPISTPNVHSYRPVDQPTNNHRSATFSNQQYGHSTHLSNNQPINQPISKPINQSKPTNNQTISQPTHRISAQRRAELVSKARTLWTNKVAVHQREIERITSLQQSIIQPISQAINQSNQTSAPELDALASNDDDAHTALVQLNVQLSEQLFEAQENYQAIELLINRVQASMSEPENQTVNQSFNQSNNQSSNQSGLRPEYLLYENDLLSRHLSVCRSRLANSQSEVSTLTALIGLKTKRISQVREENQTLIDRLKESLVEASNQQKRMVSDLTEEKLQITDQLRQIIQQLTEENEKLKQQLVT